MSGPTADFGEQFRASGASAVRLTQRGELWRLEVELPHRDMTVVVEHPDVHEAAAAAHLAIAGRWWRGDERDMSLASAAMGLIVAEMHDSADDVRMLMRDFPGGTMAMSRGLRHVAMGALMGISDTGVHPVQFARDVIPTMVHHRDRRSSRPPEHWNLAIQMLQWIVAIMTGDEKRVQAFKSSMSRISGTEGVVALSLLSVVLVEELAAAQGVEPFDAAQWLALQFPKNE